MPIKTNELAGIIVSRGMSQKEVAHHLGISANTFYAKMSKGIFGSDEIEKMIGVSRSTLNDWKVKFPDISDTLKRGKEVIDRKVENALLKRALGYEYVESEYEVVALDDIQYQDLVYRLTQAFKDEHPEATDSDIKRFQQGIPREKRILIKQKTKEVVPDTTAQIFWLKNRKPEVWRDKQDVKIEGDLKHEIQIEITGDDVDD